jgi:hypothetical protein
MDTFIGKPERKRALGRPELLKWIMRQKCMKAWAELLCLGLSQLVYFVNTWKNIWVP